MRKKALVAVLIVILLGVAAWFYPSVRDWYYMRQSVRDIPPGGQQEAEMLETEERAHDLVPLQGTFVSIDDDILTWSLETRVAMPEGVVVTREERRGRLIPAAVVGRVYDPEGPLWDDNPDLDTAAKNILPGVMPIKPSSMRTGEQILIFIPQNQDDAEIPQIWQIIAAS